MLYNYIILIISLLHHMLLEYLEDDLYRSQHISLLVIHIYVS
nr:MAG TPA: hypothetical protein [Bacteriophage sp.]